MLKGLEISILNKVDVYNPFFKARIDPEFFQKKNISKYDLILSKSHKTLAEIAFVTDGEHGNAITSPEGYSKYYGARNVLNGILSDNNVEYITQEHHHKLRKTVLRPRDVLISCVGANIGFAAIVPDNVGIANIVRNVALIRSNSAVKNEYLLAYFLSSYGKDLYVRMNTGNAQPLVSLDYINTVPVFIPSLVFQEKMVELASIALKSINQSKEMYSLAESLLLESLGLKDFESSKDPVNVKCFSESFGSSGRLDAEYYQVKYEEIQRHIESFERGHTTVKNEFSISKEVIDRSRKAYNYTEISDVDVSDGSVTCNLVETEDLPANGKYVLLENQIIISKVRPYRGAVGIIRDTPENHVGSGAFTVLNEKTSYKVEVLQTILRSKPYQELIMKYNVGSSYPVVKDEDILNLPIPKLGEIEQRKIVDLVEKSFILKKQSEHCMRVAKIAVEMAIEHNEDVAISYIKDNTN